MGSAIAADLSKMQYNINYYLRGNKSIVNKLKKLQFLRPRGGTQQFLIAKMKQQTKNKSCKRETNCTIKEED